VRVAHVHSTYDGHASTWHAAPIGGCGLIARHATNVIGVSEAALESFWDPTGRDARPGRVYDGVDTRPLMARPRPRVGRAELGLDDAPA
jgi:hypothetical protein